MISYFLGFCGMSGAKGVHAVWDQALEGLECSLLMDKWSSLHGYLSLLMAWQLVSKKKHCESAKS